MNTIILSFSKGWELKKRRTNEQEYFEHYLRFSGLVNKIPLKSTARKKSDQLAFPWLKTLQNILKQKSEPPSDILTIFIVGVLENSNSNLARKIRRPTDIWIPEA